MNLVHSNESPPTFCLDFPLALGPEGWVPDLDCEFNDDGFLLTFKLPRGSYATSFLREIVAYNTDSGVREQAFG